MGVRQANSGNPEVKYVWLTDNFVGGVNIAYSDDNVDDGEFRQLVNYDLNNRGSISKRQGYIENFGLTDLLFNEIDGQPAPVFPIFSQTNVKTINISEVVLFKLLENTNNVWSILSKLHSVKDLQQIMSLDETYIIKFLYIIKTTDGKGLYYVNKYTIKAESLERVQEATGEINADFAVENNLMNVSYGEDNKNLYITSNKQGLIIFNKTNNTFKYSNPKTGGQNEVYKPSSLEVRKVGFNVLGDDPLSWLASSSISTESIQGVYLTTMDRIPVQDIPVSYKFQVNIIYTGTVTEFDIKLFDIGQGNDDPLQKKELTINKVKNGTYSKAGLLVYDIEVKVQTVNDLEMNVSIKGNSNIATYRDYFKIGTPSPQAKKVEKLNVGEMRVEEIGQRLVYYGGNTIWFSEINVFDYIPNFNYVILPIGSTDEIVKIAFYRTCYIVFTRNRIYRITGTFGDNQFAVSLVSNELGCVAPNSVEIVNNKLVFLSQVGLRQLKYDVFRENLENLETIDEKVTQFFPSNKNAYGIIIGNQYGLLQNFRGKIPSITIGYTQYLVPDTCRYYYDMDAFVFDTYPLDEKGKPVYPYFLTQVNGEVYTMLKDVKNRDVCWHYGNDFTDFGREYVAILKTAGINTQYPLHKKKFKNIIVKTIGGDLAQPLFMQVYADGTLYYDTWVGASHVNEIGEVIYDKIDQPATIIPAGGALLETPVAHTTTVLNPDGSISSMTEPVTILDESSISLGSRSLGETPIIVRKIKLPVACKNIAIKITTLTGEKLDILAIGYTFKLGKVKE